MSFYKFLSVFLITVLLVGFFPVRPASASNYSFDQTSWSGGQSSDTIVHGFSANRTEYSTKDANLDASAGTELDLSTTSGSVTQTTDADFNAGTHGPPVQTETASNSVKLKQYITNVNFSYTGGQQTWTVPAGVTSITVDMAGGSGGASGVGSAGGNAGRVQTSFSVTPGNTLYIYVAGVGSVNGWDVAAGGYNGGGNSGGNGYYGGTGGGGGGGETDIRIGGTALGNRVVVAGGGGGGGYSAIGGDGAGTGGSNNGSNGNTGATGAGGGYGGTQTAGGNGGSAGGGSNGGSGGGGGGGYWGGGGGGGGYGSGQASTSNTGGNGGGYGGGSGGGGSSYCSGSCSGTTYSVHSSSGNGYVNISYPAYYSSGTYTSGRVDIGENTSFGNLDWGTTQTANTNIVLKVKSYATDPGTPNFTGCNDIVTINSANADSSTALSGSNCVTNGHPYIFYQATFNTSNTAETPSLDDLTFNFNKYAANQTLTSLPYNSVERRNAVTSINAKGTLGASGTAVKVQVKSASTQGGLSSAQWCGPTACNGTDVFNFTSINSDPGETQYIAYNHPLRNGGDDQWFQYRIILDSTGAYTPTLESVTLNYEFPTFVGTQTNWGNGESSEDAVHPINNNPPNDWRYYTSKDTSLLVINGGADLELNISGSPLTQNLVSSAFDSTTAANRIDVLQWNETLPANTSVTVSLKSADSKANLSSASWNDYTKDSSGCSKSGTTVTCPIDALADSLKDGSGDQWFQYKVTLQTTDGLATPTFSDIYIGYIASDLSKIIAKFRKFIRSFGTIKMR